LTEPGRILLGEARETVARADLAVQRTKRAERGEVGRLAVGFIPWTDFTVLFAKLIRRFGERQPEVRLDFHSLSTPAHTAALRDGRIDVGFFAPAAPPADLAFASILTDSIVVVLPERHPLCRYSVVPLGALAEEPHIVVARERIASFYDLIISLCRRAGFTVQVRHETDHPQTTLALVAAGVGVSLVPSSFKAVRRPGVVYRPVRPSAKVEMIAAWRQEDRSPTLAAFLRVMRQVARCAPPSRDRGRPRPSHRSASAL
jgi:DNA-binding transcriptional LysR family regulator